MNKQKYVSIAAVILWCAVIFFNSHQPATDSNAMSMGIVDAIKQAIPVSSDLNLNYLVRKWAHFVSFGLLAVLTYHMFRQFRGTARIAFPAALIWTTFYAMTDEFHQRFVEGRGAQWQDVVIDLFGAITALGLVFVIRKFRSRRTGQ
ncbi:MAG: VanZ family protein [Bacilli bacterium]